MMTLGPGELDTGKLETERSGFIVGFLTRWRDSIERWRDSISHFWKAVSGSERSKLPVSLCHFVTVSSAIGFCWDGADKYRAGCFVG